MEVGPQRPTQHRIEARSTPDPTKETLSKGHGETTAGNENDPERQPEYLVQQAARDSVVPFFVRRSNQRLMHDRVLRARTRRRP